VRECAEDPGPLRSDLVTGPGGRQILIADPDGNLVELFQAAPRS